MTDANVWYYKAKNAQEGFNLATQFLEGHEVKSKFPIEIDFSFIGGECPQIVGRGNGFEVVLSFYEQEVSINLTLKLMLRPLKRKIIDTLSDEIKRVL